MVVDIVNELGGLVAQAEDISPSGGSQREISLGAMSNETKFSMKVEERKIIGRHGNSLSFGAGLSKFLAYNGLKEVWVNSDGLELRDAILGSTLAQYRFGKYRTKSQPDEVSIHYLSGSEGVLKKARAIAEAVNFARDLGNEPAGSLSPAMFVKAVKQKFKGLPVEIGVLDEKDLEEQGFGGIIGVGKGSVNPPRLLTARYTGSGERPIALVGKGVVFDSGGINLKPSDGGIERMYSDKCGAADVISVTLGAALLALRADLIAIAPLVENMPSGGALKPGDIIKTYSGKTVEVLNTDAEGRLILADALAYAQQEFNPVALIDVATLTGTKVQALGSRIGAVMGNNQELVNSIVGAGDRTCEPYWQLPLPAFYQDLLKSERADIRNVVGSGFREAGAIIAGLFLNEFVKETPWAHLDIAGSALANSDSGWTARGATGFSVRSLLELAETGLEV